VVVEVRDARSTCKNVHACPSHVNVKCSRGHEFLARDFLHFVCSSSSFSGANAQRIITSSLVIIVLVVAAANAAAPLTLSLYNNDTSLP